MTALPNLRSGSSPALPTLLLAVLPVTALAYAYSIGSGFLGDDFPLIDYASRTSMLTAFSGRVDAYYRPVVWASFAFEYSIWGTTAGGYHLGNVIIHLVNTGLALMIARKITGNAITAGVVGLYFGLTPTHAGSVVWLFARTDLLCATFYFATVLSFFYWLDDLSFISGLRTGALCVLALLCKEMAISLPIIGLVIAFTYSSGRLSTRLIGSCLASLPLVLGTILYLAGRYVYVDGLAISPMHDHWTPAKVAINLARYAATLTIPLSLEEIKPFFRSHPSLLLGASGLIALAGIAGVFALRKSPSAIPVVACTGIALLPVVRLYAPWYLYIPSLGVAILVGLLVMGIPEHVHRRGLFRLAAACVVVVHLLGLAQFQATVRTSGQYVAECVEGLGDVVRPNEVAVVTAVPAEFRRIPAFGWIYNLRYGLEVLGYELDARPLVGVRISDLDARIESAVTPDGRLSLTIPEGDSFFRLPAMVVTQGAVLPEPGYRLDTEDAVIEVRRVNSGGFPTDLILEPKSFSLSDPKVRLFNFSQGNLIEVTRRQT